MNSEPTTNTVFIASGISFSIAVAILIVAVLPAEFGIDPLGAGKRPVSYTHLTLPTNREV